MTAIVYSDGLMDRTRFERSLRQTLRVGVSEEKI